MTESNEFIRMVSRPIAVQPVCTTAFNDQLKQHQENLERRLNRVESLLYDTRKELIEKEKCPCLLT